MRFRSKLFADGGVQLPGTPNAATLGTDASGNVIQGTGDRALSGTMLVIGASIEQNEGSDWPLDVGVSDTPRLQPNTIFNPNGPLNWASMFLGGSLRPIKNLAMAGEASDTQLANMQNPANFQYALGQSQSLNFVYLGHITGDDPGSLTPAQSAANDLAAYNLLRATYPSAIVILPTLPANNINTNNWATRATVNPQRRSLAASNLNTLLWEFEAIFVDPATGFPPTTYSQDVIHPNPTGAMMLGRDLAGLLAPYAPAKSMVNDYTNDSRVTAANGGWGIDAMMRGTPGQGVTATNWTLTAPAGATRNLVARSDKYGNWQELVYGGTAGQLAISRAIPLAFPANALVQAECEIMFTGTLPATGITDIDFGLVLGNASFAAIANTYALGDTLANRGPYADPGAGVVLTVRTPPLLVPTGVSISGGQSFVQFSMNGTATSGSIRVGRLSLMRLA